MKIYDETLNNFDNEYIKKENKLGVFEKILNFITCRCDINKDEYEIKPVSFFELFRFGSKIDKIYVIIGIICGILAGMGYTFPFYISGKLVTVLIEHGDKPYDDKLLKEGYLYVAADIVMALSTLILTYYQTYLLKKACKNITSTLRIEFIKALLRQDALWLDKQKFGTLNNQLTENIDVIRDGIGEKIGLVIRGVSSLVGCCIFSVIVNWKTFLINFAAVPISVILMSFMGRLINDTSKKQQPFIEKLSSTIQETIINIKTIQCCNGEKQMIEKYNQISKNGRIYGILPFIWSGFFDGITFFLLYVFFILAFYYGGILAFFGDITAGDVFIIPNAFFGAAYYIAIVSPHFVSILKARISCARIYSKIDRIPMTRNSENGIKLDAINGEIEFHNIEFGYSNSKKILNGLSFIAEAGATTALVGKSGCGKSTCMSLLTRLYESISGYITIDKININDIELKSLRKVIGFVQQEPVLFTETIKENIKLGDDKITDKDIEKACKIANAHDFIMNLIEKYDTLIGQGGIKLSGGQKQRIAIARAIINDPKILLLDEATSALDVHSECHVQEALKSASKGRTTIVIAHRLSTLRDATKIVVIDDGKVIEEGTHSDLRNKKGFYEKLVKAQEFKESNDKHEEQNYNEIEDFAKNRGDSYFSEKEFFITHSSGRLPPQRPSITINNDYDINVINDKNGNQHNGLLLLYKNTKGNRIKLIIAFIFSLLRGLELPLFVLLLNYIFLSIGNTTNWTEYHHKLSTFSILGTALGVFSFFTIFIPTSLYGWAAECVVDFIKIRVFASVLRRDAKYFDQSETSNAKIIAKINSDSPQLKSALDNRMLHLINNVFAIFILLIQGFIFSWQIFLSGLLGITLMTFFMSYYGNLAQKNSSNTEQVDNTANISVEIIENIRTIQLLTQENYFVEKFSELIHLNSNKILTVAHCESIVLAIGMASPYICDFMSYCIGLLMIYNGFTSPNECFVSSMNVCMTSWAIQFSSMSAMDLLHAKPAAESLIPLIDDDIDNNGISTNKTQKKPNKEINGLIEAKKVHFAYPSRPHVNVANGLNLKVYAGKTVALVGPSGGGKSTIIQLLERLYVEQSGNILIDNNNIDGFDLHNLREQMALVGQEPVLFSGTIIENITLGVENISINEINEACEIANASKFIENLPLGYETEVGEKGAQLSGGQKQRIAIARAMIRKPKILLLDEATSALDAESERAVQEALDKASESRTCITIAHRLSSIQNADNIYFIENGKVVESGTHDELLETQGKYADLVKKQILAK